MRFQPGLAGAYLGGQGHVVVHQMLHFLVQNAAHGVLFTVRSLYDQLVEYLQQQAGLL